MSYLRKSLEEIESVFFKEPKEDSSFLIKKIYEIRRKKLMEYTVDDLRIMIGQKQGLDYLVPLALNYLEENPFSEGDFFEGDLLVNVLKCSCEFWKRDRANVVRMNIIIDKAISSLEDMDLTEEIKQLISHSIKEYQDFILDSTVLNNNNNNNNK